jgi:hypothetical protein
MSDESMSNPIIMHWKGTGVIGIETGIACAAMLNKKGIKKLVNFLNAHRDEFEIQEVFPKAGEP